jgi:hypothetical protein
MAKVVPVARGLKIKGKQAFSCRHTDKAVLNAAQPASSTPRLEGLTYLHLALAALPSLTPGSERKNWRALCLVLVGPLMDRADHRRLHPLRQEYPSWRSLFDWHRGNVP